MTEERESYPGGVVSSTAGPCSACEVNEARYALFSPRCLHPLFLVFFVTTVASSTVRVTLAQHPAIHLPIFTELLSAAGVSWVFTRHMFRVITVSAVGDGTRALDGLAA